MKKLVLTIAIILGMTFCASAQYFDDNKDEKDRGPRQGGGLFGFGAVSDELFYGASYMNGSNPLLPLLPSHFNDESQDAAPLGSGALLLIGFGAAYALGKKSKK